VSAPAPTDIAAIVVLFNPCSDVLDNIDSYASQVGRVIAVDNTPSAGASIQAELDARAIVYVPMGDNMGIATALNVGCKRALALGYSWVLTMDQDSTAPPALVRELARCIANPGSEQVAIVAPAWEQAGGLAAETFDSCTDLDFAMTSGNLLRLAAFDALGGFREDLFIDHVDNEFCMRARRNGWRIVQRQDTVLLHRMGTLQHVRFPIPCYITDYSPVRRYYMVRNLFELRREFGREFPDWLRSEYKHWRKEFVKIIVAEPRRLRKLRMMFRGWLDYRRRDFGRYEDLHSS
jgi:rhamnosyltransferase